MSSPAHDAHAAAAHEPHGDEPIVSEPDEPNNTLILGLIIATVITIVVLVLIAFRIFGSMVKEDLQLKVLGHQNTALDALHAQESAKLTRYQWVNQKDGTVRIPATSARDLVIGEYRKPLPLPAAVPGMPAPAPAPAAPASAGSAPTPAPSAAASH